MVAVTLSACGSGPHGPHRSPNLIAPAARYLELAGSANATIDAAKGRLRTGTEDLSATEGDLRSIADAKRAFDRDLTSVQFGPAVEPAVRRLLESDAELERRLDAGALAGTPAELASMSPAILSAGQTAVSSADAVRRLLGLPSLS